MFYFIYYLILIYKKKTIVNNSFLKESIVRQSTLEGNETLVAQSDSEDDYRATRLFSVMRFESRVILSKQAHAVCKFDLKQASSHVYNIYEEENSVNCVAKVSLAAFPQSVASRCERRSFA